MQSWRPLSSIEIDRRLRDEFRRLLKEYGVSAQETDPILAVMFSSFAAQLAEVYEQAATSIPLAILDELMAGLGMPERRARAAQTIVRFAIKDGREVFEAGTELVIEAASREKLTFALDCGLEVSNAEIALVAIYQDGSLRLHQGTDLAKEFEEARPSFEAVQAELGPRPAIFIAVNCGAGHLSRHGFYFELLPEARDLLGYLRREVWCLLDEEGGIRAEGLLRPRAGNAGVQRLEWLIGEADDAGGEEQHHSSRSGAKSLTAGAWPSSQVDELLPEGFYGNRSFLLPSIPGERRFLTKLPKKMEAPLRRIFQQTSQSSGKDLFDRPRAWLCIGLPQEASSIGEDLKRIVLHCATASNIEILNLKQIFAENGYVIPVTTGGGRTRHLVKPFSIKGERGTEYLPETEPSADEFAGRYRFRQGKLEIEPARTARGDADNYANVRLLLCNGSLGNNVGPGEIKTFLNRTYSRTFEIRNMTQAAGGDDGETLPRAKQRFTEMLLSRDRPVTFPDLEAVARSVEPKIREVKAASVLERGGDRLHRVQQVTVVLDRDSFTLPEEEVEILQRELESTLQERSLLGLKVRVKAEFR